MISVRSGLRILVTGSPVDFRRGMGSLAMLVTDTLLGVSGEIMWVSVMVGPPAIFLADPG